MPVLPDEEYQRIRHNGLFPSKLDLSPKQTRELFVSNIYQRTLALLMGDSSLGTQLIRATTDGRLKVSNDGSTFVLQDVLTPVVPDTWTDYTWFYPEFEASKWDLLVETYDVEIRFRDEANENWFDSWILPVGMYSLLLRSPAIQYQNRAASEVCDLQIVAFS